MRKGIFCLLATVVCFSGKTEAVGDCFSVDADYLYWHAVQTSMNYGVVTDDLVNFGTLKVLDQSTDMASAFRIGAFYHPACYCWDVSFYWTRYHNTSSGGTDQPIIVANKLLAPNITFVIGGGSIGGPAVSKWRLRLDMFDLNFSFPVWACCPCTISPYIGLKGGIIDQTERIQYINFLNTGSANMVNAVVTQTNDFSGIGPKAGFEGNYSIGCGLSLVGDIALAALYGPFDSKDQTDMDESGVASTHISRNNINRCVPTLQLFIGLDWVRCFCRGYQFSVGAGYETQFFWNTWRIQNSTIQDFFITDVGFGDLCLHGLTVKFSVGY